jgi:peptidoglycan/LPS O-acetylase OafA/YrhL
MPMESSVTSPPAAVAPPDPALPRLWPERFDMIDAWRGIAATGVVVAHVGAGHNIGHYSVILFFVISGYCIAAAGESCVRRGWGFRGFMWRRVRRIYPPYLLTVAFFFVTRMIREYRGGEGFSRPLYQWAMNLSLTQWLYLVAHPQTWPFHNDTLFVASFWTLCYEEQFYLVMGLLIIAAGWVRRRNLLLLVTLVALAWNFTHLRLVYGFFLDYWALFAIGALLFYRLCRMRHVLLRRAVDVWFLSFAIGFGLLAFFRPQDTAGSRPMYLEFCIASTFALLLLFTRPLSEGFKDHRFGRVLMALGLISYSLYLVQEFNLVLIATISKKLLPGHPPAGLFWAVQTMGHILLASVFWYFCERPFLNRRIVPGARTASVSGVAAALVDPKEPAPGR